MSDSQVHDLNYSVILPFFVYMGAVTGRRIDSGIRNSWCSHHITSGLDNILRLRAYFVVLTLLGYLNLY